MIGKIYYQKINSDVSNFTNLALCFLFLSRNLFFLYSNYLWTEICFPAKYCKKMEPCEPLKPAMVLKTVRFDRGSSGFMHFSHREVLSSKRTGMTRGSWLIRSDRTVRSQFENHALRKFVKHLSIACYLNFSILIWLQEGPHLFAMNQDYCFDYYIFGDLFGSCKPYFYHSFLIDT